MVYFFKRLKWRIIWSWQGCVLAWKEEYSFRSWIWANLASLALTLYLPLSAAERAIVIALGILVVAMELLNTAIERAVDRISEEKHPLSGAAKDAGSAAVAVTALACGAAWLTILLG